MKTKTQNTNKIEHRKDKSGSFHASDKIRGSGEMAERIRTFDWSKTPLGPIANWTQSLCFSLNLMLQSPASLVILWGEEGISFYNDAYISFAGGKHPSLLGSRYEESWVEAAAFVRKIIDKCLQGESLSYNRFHNIVKRNNKPEPIWKDLQCSPILDEEGKPAGILIVTIETTQSVQAEKALKEREERYQLILDGTNEGVWDTDLQSKTTYWNDRLYEIIGYSREEVGKPGLEFLSKIIHPEDEEKVLTEIHKTLKVGGRSDMEYRIKHKKGHYIFLHSKGQTISNAEGKISRFAGITLDVSDRKKAEEILKEKEERLSAIFNQTSVGIAETDLTGKFVLANDQFCQIVGRSRQELYQLGITDITHAGDLAENIWRLEKVIREGIPAIIEKRFIRPDGSEIWVKNNISLVRDVEGIPMYVLAVSQDITERKQSEQEKNQLLIQTQALNVELEISQLKLLNQNEHLAKVNRELDSFVYRISHDLRAPLASVLGLVNLCRLDVDENNQRKYLSLIEKSVSRLDTFIHDIIDFSKNNRVEVSVKEIDLSALVAECIEGLSYMEGYENVDKRVEIKQDTPFFSDIFRLKIICNNLLSNAIKYRSSQVEQSTLLIKIQVSGNKALMEFVDNGQGIARDKMDKIFGMFYRASDASKGSGLGLYIVKEVLQTLKGSIQVQSQIEGGTRFVVEIPNSFFPLEE